MDDAALLAAFVDEQSEEAFNALVRRHVPMVYAVCRRQLRDEHWAEDVTQAVFILLAKKAASLPSQVVLGGWLYRTAVYACSNSRDLKRTRAYHENRVTPMHMSEEDAVERAEIEELLDEGLMQLPQAQREVIILRYLEERPLTEVAKLRGQSLYAAQKSMDAGMAKLRKFLAQRGATVSVAVIAVALAEESVKALPAHLAASVGNAALHQAHSSHVTQLVARLAHHAGRAKLLGSLVAVAAVVAVALPWLYFSAGGAHGVMAATAQGAVDQAQELAALQETLRRAEGALRRMDGRALAEVVLFTDAAQSQHWQLMTRLFAADLALKRSAASRFGPDGVHLTTIHSFADRLDETVPRIDLASAEWTISPPHAAVHFGYLDGRTPGASLYFLKTGSHWQIDATRSVDVALEGLTADHARAPLDLLPAAQQSLVLDKMNQLQAALQEMTKRIDTGAVESLGQAQEELRLADAQAPGRAFFHVALRFDDTNHSRP